LTTFYFVLAVILEDSAKPKAQLLPSNTFECILAYVANSNFSVVPTREKRTNSVILGSQSHHIRDAITLDGSTDCADNVDHNKNHAVLVCVEAA
jgi:hypothetical protein